MVDGASVTVPPQIVMAVFDDIPDLRASDSDDNRTDALIYVRDLGNYYWDAASVSVDNGSSVIRPDDRSPLQAGRWLQDLTFGGFKNVSSENGILDIGGDPTNGKVSLPAGDIVLNGVWSLLAQGRRIIGVPGKTRLVCNTNRAVMRLLDGCRDLVFEDIIFDCTYVGGSTSTTVGAVYSLDATLTNIQFTRCTFRALQTAVNAIHLTPATGAGTGVIDGLRFTDCVIDGALRMGLEISHTMADARYKNVVWEGGYIGGCSSIGLSLSGYGENCDIGRGTTFGSNGTSQIECVGASRSRFSGTFTAGTAALLSFTGDRTMYDNIIENISCTTVVGGGCTIRNQVNLLMTGNRLDMNGRVGMKKVQKAKVIGDVWRTRTLNSLFVEGTTEDGGENGPSTGIEIADTILDNSASLTAQATVRFWGATSTANLVQDSCQLIDGSSGVTADNGNSATNNWIMPGRSGVQTRRNQITTLAFTSDANRDLSAATTAPTLLSGNYFSVTGAITANRTMTLAPYAPGNAVKIKNNTTGGQSITIAVGATTIVIANGATADVVFGNNTISAL